MRHRSLAGVLLACVLLAAAPVESRFTNPPAPAVVPAWTRLAHVMRSRYRPGGPCVELQHALWRSAWDARLIPVMVAIARSESGCRADAMRITAEEISVGALQINVVAWRGVSLACARDYGCAARAALSIYRRQGLGAWTVYRTGAYRRMRP